MAQRRIFPPPIPDAMLGIMSGMTCPDQELLLMRFFGHDWW
jgi:hypothetical protein